MNSFPSKANEKLLERKHNNSFRKLSDFSNLMDFYSNDYLSFNQDPFLLNKVRDYLTSQNLEYGATGSRLVSGNRNEMVDLEQKFARFYKSESALFFSSGFNANLALFSSIAGKSDTILYDSLIHASIREGIRLSSAKSYSFEHNNLEKLEQKIQRAQGDIFIVVESLYSMDGDFVDLKRLVEISNKYNAYIILDEAHTTGLSGKNGNGYACLLELEEKIFARIMTFGKAMSCHGAVVLGSNKLRDYLINFGKAFIYTTAPDILSFKKVEWAIEYRANNPHFLTELEDNIRYFESLIKKDTIRASWEPPSPIQTISIPGNDNVKQLEYFLYQNGIASKAILSPTVSLGEERLRICIHRKHKKENILHLYNLLK